MKLLTDEQLCELDEFDLMNEEIFKGLALLHAKKKNQWKLQQELSEYLSKVKQLKAEKQHQ